MSWHSCGNSSTSTLSFHAGVATPSLTVVSKTLFHSHSHPRSRSRSRWGHLALVRILARARVRTLVLALALEDVVTTDQHFLIRILARSECQITDRIRCSCQTCCVPHGSGARFLMVESVQVLVFEPPICTCETAHVFSGLDRVVQKFSRSHTFCVFR